MRLFNPVTASLAGALVVVLGACVSSNPNTQAAKEPIRLDLSIKAAKDVNPDDKGRAAPIVVRVYELKNDAAFAAADFFSLQDRDKTLLADDVNAREEFLLRPGDTKSVRRKSNPSTLAIGILAAYRDLPNAVWRETYPLPPAPDAAWYRRAGKVKLNIDLDANALKVTESK
ncbi:type VI secretion system lipoprotein TssJ [Paraburkholderia fungorum]|uniref:type VI secretion system lipoprotein TssJ n=1 Tax=Paraburkholderia fungorum TaxID=134537 RepID=UPI0038B88C4C